MHLATHSAAYDTPRRPRAPFLAAGILAVGLALGSVTPWPADPAPIAAPSAIPQPPVDAEPLPVVPPTDVAPPEVVPRGPRETVITLDPGDTLLDLLGDAGVAAADVTAVVAVLHRHVNPRQLQSGQDIHLLFVPDGEGEVLRALSLAPDATRTITVARTGDGFTARVEVEAVTHGAAAARLTVQTSLYDAAVAAGVPYGVLAGAVRLFSHEVDFQRDLHPGDVIEVLYERSTTPSGRVVSAGPLLFARLKLGGRTLSILRHAPRGGEAEYFDADGVSIRKALLRTPLDAIRITSGFGMRRHPILGYSRMHRGVDFGAPSGTAVYAAGDGVVVEAGTKGGYGTFVRLRHTAALETAYGHLLRLAPGLRVGQRVRQGQVIGKVGATGQATGPHLHFEVCRNGQAIDPSRLDLAAKRRLEGADLKAFRAVAKEREVLVQHLAPQPANLAATTPASGRR